MIHNIDKTKGENFLTILRRMLKDNKTKIDICENRDKNYVFYYLYHIDKNIIRNILSQLTIEDLRDIRKNTNPNYPPDDLFIFSKEVFLNNSAGQEISEKLYIKLSINEKGKLVIVISFHDAKYSF